jgi:hypothetical protein
MWNSKQFYWAVGLAFIGCSMAYVSYPILKTDVTVAVRSVDDKSLNALLENGVLVEVSEKERFIFQEGEKIYYCKFKSILGEQYKFRSC